MPLYTLIRTPARGDRQVTTAKIADSNVTTAKIADSSVTTLKIADANVTTAKLENSAVTTAKIADVNVTTGKLADDAVTVDKLADVSGVAMSQNVSGALDVNFDDSTIGVNGSDQLYVKADGITATELADDAVDTAAIQDSAVTTAKIADDAVTSDKIATDAVGSDQIAADAVTSSELDLSDDYAFTGAITIDAAGSISWPTAPTNSSDLANKAYVDSLSAGLSWKQAARVATTEDISLASAPAAIDGVTLSSGDRVLVWQQSTGSQNGIYVFNGAGSAMTRADDMNDADEFPSAAVFVTQGDTYADLGFVCTDDSVTVGTTAVAFVEFTGAYNVVAGDGLTKTGNTLNVVGGSGLSVTADAIDLALYSAGGLSSSQGVGSDELGIVANGDKAIAVDSDGVQVVLHDTNPALTFGLGTGGLLVTVDGTKGMERNAVGLAAKITGAMEFDGGSLDVKNLGIDTARLAADAVTAAKIADDAVQPEHLHPDTLALLKGYTNVTRIALTDGQTAIAIPADCPAEMPGHLLFLNGRLMELGANDAADKDYYVSGTDFVLEQAAVSGDKVQIVFDATL